MILPSHTRRNLMTYRYSKSVEASERKSQEQTPEKLHFKRAIYLKERILLDEALHVGDALERAVAARLALELLHQRLNRSTDLAEVGVQVLGILHTSYN